MCDGRLRGYHTIDPVLRLGLGLPGLQYILLFSLCGHELLLYFIVTPVHPHLCTKNTIEEQGQCEAGRKELVSDLGCRRE